MSPDDLPGRVGPTGPRVHRPHGPSASAPGHAGPMRAHPVPRPARPVLARQPSSLVRVVLCEDQEVFRLGLRVILEAEPDMAVVAETDHLPDALTVTDQVPVQVVIARQGLVEGATLPLLRDLCRTGTAGLVPAAPRAGPARGAAPRRGSWRAPPCRCCAPCAARGRRSWSSPSRARTPAPTSSRCCGPGSGATGRAGPAPAGRAGPPRAAP